jgi:hypothetical protein
VLNIITRSPELTIKTGFNQEIKKSAKIRPITGIRKSFNLDFSAINL